MLTCNSGVNEQTESVGSYGVSLGKYAGFYFQTFLRPTTSILF